MDMDIDEVINFIIRINNKAHRLDSLKVDQNGLCKDCNKSKRCNPHNNYGINAISCSIYVKRKA